MKEVNQSAVPEFVLLGLGHSQDAQVLLFMLFLVVYVTTIIGNMVIMILVLTDSHLHSPMYFFLANLSFVDMWLSSVTTPKMIKDFLTENKDISFEGCMCQILFVHFVGGGEMVLLVVMAYDCYVAICKPLHYSTIMGLQRCTGLGVTSWVVGFVHSIVQLVPNMQLPFFGPREIDNFFCDIPLIIKLACLDTYCLEVLVNIDSGAITVTCFVLLLIHIYDSHRQTF
ncbi:olfactory receptor 4K3-like [Nannospalax galili]|uniref:olfactory receptor 4K3-like n=1 Tax=Nannospalax galili TaxID=1026970 RepID=UPI0004ED30BB|nr:olfactory receptor 4K3-like [Nannospalax galili]